VSETATFDWDLIRRYDTRGPRYTSYPTALQFSEGFSAEDYAEQVHHSNTASAAPLSIYVHIPFCEHLCFYCACNKIATRNRALASRYLDALFREIDLRSELFSRDRAVEQLHFGGGTPTFLTMEQLGGVVQRLKQWFDFRADEHGDYSIEVDPRTVTPGDMQALRDIGFNRASLGVQDFDETVQEAVHRIQPREQTLGIMQAAREAGIRSINVDLIYGLPCQSVESMRETLAGVLGAAPDRISLFNYAHLPDRFPAQKRIRDEDIPDPAEKFHMLKTSVEMITAAGYVYIGMDHFALPTDELARARNDGTLCRSFQGYTTHAGCELIGFGVSSIGQVGRSFSQNAYRVDDYERLLEAGRLPVTKGVVMDDDDVIRAHIINELMCFGSLDMQATSARFGIEFADYFRRELAALGRFADDRLLTMDAGRIEVMEQGRMLIRNICATFDRYLQEHAQTRFSRTI